MALSIMATIEHATSTTSHNIAGSTMAARFIRIVVSSVNSS